MPNADIIVTKTQLMQAVINGLGHESFEHSSEGTFDITVMREMGELLVPMGIVQKLLVPLDNICGFIRTNRVVEESRLDDLSAASWMDDPGIIIMMPDGTSLIVDGHHRALRREREGWLDMKFHGWPLHVANQVARVQEGWGKIPGVDWGGSVDDLPCKKGE